VDLGFREFDGAAAECGPGDWIVPGHPQGQHNAVF
jgi:hypothetical protein